MEDREIFKSEFDEIIENIQKPNNLKSIYYILKYEE